MRMVRWATAITTTVMLFGTIASSALGQSPSPEPPPWFGGRVEMPEHGFAVTVPDDWTALDPAADSDAQLHVVADNLGLPVLPDWYGDFVGAMASVALLTWNWPTDRDIATCSFVRVDGEGWPVASLADQVHQLMSTDERVESVAPPVEVDLPVGLAWLVRFSKEEGYPFGRESGATYLVGTSERLLQVVCTSPFGQRPEDAWLSIVGTIEFLPAE